MFPPSVLGADGATGSSPIAKEFKVNPTPRPSPALRRLGSRPGELQRQLLVIGQAMLRAADVAVVFHRRFVQLQVALARGAGAPRAQRLHLFFGHGLEAARDR